MKLSQQLTDKVMRNLPVPEKGNDLSRCPVQRGLAGRVTAAGDRAFVLCYYFGGKERRDTIGGFPEWTTSAAWKVAKSWKRDADLGIDPRPERKPEPQPDTDDLFESRAEEFLAHGRTKRGRLLRQATKKEYRRALLTYAIPLHGKPLAEIRRGQIASLIQDLASARGAVTAMRTRAALSRLYSWAIASGHVEANPVTGTEGYATEKRDRVLSDGELAAIWAATEERTDFNLIVRLCLWTGCRRSEAGGMADSELDGATWAIPGARTKNHRALVLPLPRQAVEALAAWPRAAGRDLLFGQGRTGFQGWSDAKERLDEQTRLDQPWKLHDARRTVETRMAGLGIPKEYVNKILNHAAAPVTQAYDHHDYLLEKANALQRWADALDVIVGSPQASNVVPLTARR
jgi:integrase